MARDVAGISRANMFEVVRAPSGVTFTPIHGTAASITYRASDGGTFTTSSHRRSGEELERTRAYQAEYPALRY